MPSAAELKEEILRLKAERNAVILAHNYQIPDIQDIADFLGDSLALAMKVPEIEADVIVFCGVDFMAETAAILNPDKTVIIPDTGARCPLASMVDAEGLKELKEKHPDAVIMAHPECRPEVLDYADHVFSTEGMVKFAKSSDAREFIVGTEKDMAYRLRKECPDKVFYTIDKAVCPTMKKITLENLRDALLNMGPVVRVPEELAERAKIPIERMISIGRGEKTS
jgi:quinolinate synthase